jgi:hypothetical protein
LFRTVNNSPENFRGLKLKHPQVRFPTTLLTTEISRWKLADLSSDSNSNQDEIEDLVKTESVVSLKSQQKVNTD